MALERDSTETTTSNDDVPVDVSAGQVYEVFLSFRGPDTRAGFTDHLYERLKDAGIKAYRDTEGVRNGEEIRPELHQAIKGSTIAIPVFSKRYAESKWCLNELVEIMKHRRSGAMKVMPIFYYVKASEVKNQTGAFEKALKVHKGCDNSIIIEWKEALTEIGGLLGWEIPSDNYRLEGVLVKAVLKEISWELKKPYLEIPDDLVGLGPHVEKIMGMLSLETSGMRIIGIHGMGGIGKTTLTKFVYNCILSKFEASSFLANACSEDIKTLKKRMKSNILSRKSSGSDDNDGPIAHIFQNKKVLIVIDDVDKKTRIEELIGKRGKHDWFTSGSRIILTTRDKDVLIQVPVNDSYELYGMDGFHSLQLFYKHAFQSDKPKEEFASLSKEIVKTTGGLPLALEVIGSSLYNLDRERWERALEKLKKVPHQDVSEKLRISYEDLDGRQKNIFLDIACFFIGQDQRVAIHFWDSDLFFPREALDVLQQKSLIKIHDNLLWMHDQLRDLGREIVLGDDITETGRQTRLWDREKATEVFMKKEGIEKIEGIDVEFDDKTYSYFTEEAFAKLSKMRLFWVNCLWDFNPISNAAPSNFLLREPQSRIFSEVRWLSWEQFPYLCIDVSNFSLLELTILNLSASSFTSEWVGWSKIKEAKNLKVLDLSWCEMLDKTPDFSFHPKLERLILERCTGLAEIHESVSTLEYLVHLNLSCCGKICKLPTELGCMGSLKELLIDYTRIVEIPRWCSLVKLEVFSANGCSSLKNCISLNNLTLLKELNLSSTRITSIPASTGDLANLTKLTLRGCRYLRRLPESGFESLIELNISCSGVKELPNSISWLRNLKRLIMYNTFIQELPTTIGMARKLEEIDASTCNFLCGLPKLHESLIDLTITSSRLQTIPDLSNLTNLKRLVFGSYETPSTNVENPNQWRIEGLSKLEELEVISCNFLKSIPKLPSSLTKSRPDICSSLVIEDKSFIKLEGLHCLEALEVLVLKNCTMSEIAELPKNLRSLNISECEKLERLPQMSNCKKLNKFWLYCCPNLVEIHGRLESLKDLLIKGCMSMVKMPDILNVNTLDSICIEGCPLSEFPELPKNLRSLEISECEKLERLPQMSNCKRLSKFLLRNCLKLVEIHGRLESLKDLLIKGCISLVKIPDILNVNTLDSICIEGCPLSEIPKLSKNLRSLEISECEKLERLPEMSNCKRLNKFLLRNCPKLVEIHGRLESLEDLLIKGCMSLVKISDILNMNTLGSICIEGCPLSEIPELSENLRSLEISECEKLERLPQMSNCKRLNKFLLRNCPKLVEIHGRLESLRNLDIYDCHSLVKIPDILDVDTLHIISIQGCPKLCHGELRLNGRIFGDGISVPEMTQRTLMKICGYMKKEELNKHSTRQWRKYFCVFFCKRE